jgi:hypothetical protein
MKPKASRASPSVGVPVCAQCCRAQVRRLGCAPVCRRIYLVWLAARGCARDAESRRRAPHFGACAVAVLGVCKCGLSRVCSPVSCLSSRAACSTRRVRPGRVGNGLGANRRSGSAEGGSFDPS